MSRIRLLARNVTLVLLALAGGAALAQNHDMSAMTSVAVVGTDYAFDAPDVVSAGWVDMTFTNAGQELHQLQVVRLNDGVTKDQIMEALQKSPDDALPLVLLVGGPGLVLPGSSQTVAVDLTRPGTYLELCLITNDDDVPHVALGMSRFFEVTAVDAEASVPALVPDLVVTMMDFGYDIPGKVKSGRQLWQVVNAGPQPHEMALMKLHEGATVADLMAAFEGQSDGPPPMDPVGGAQAQSVGITSYATFDLTPGQYVALCFVPDAATGQPHAVLGMITAFTVVD